MVAGVAWLDFGMLLMFLYIESRSIAVARGRSEGLGKTFILVVIAAIGLTSLLLNPEVGEQAFSGLRAGVLCSGRQGIERWKAYSPIVFVPEDPRVESKPWIGRILAAAILIGMAGAPLRAQETEEATVTTMPWSGWWWPADTGQLLLGYRGEVGPLVKHDVVSGRHATQWEQSTPFHFDLVDAADWWGHCHAWAAAAVLEPEPKHDVTQNGATFHVGDLKGLLTEAHYSDQVISYGARFYGNPGDDLEDMYPATVWYVLRTYLYQNKTPIVFDLNPEPRSGAIRPATTTSAISRSAPTRIRARPPRPNRWRSGRRRRSVPAVSPIRGSSSSAFPPSR